MSKLWMYTICFRLNDFLEVIPRTKLGQEIRENVYCERVIGRGRHNEAVFYCYERRTKILLKSNKLFNVLRKL